MGSRLNYIENELKQIHYALGQHEAFIASLLGTPWRARKLELPSSSLSESRLGAIETDLRRIHYELGQHGAMIEHLRHKNQS